MWVKRELTCARKSETRTQNFSHSILQRTLRFKVQISIIWIRVTILYGQKLAGNHYPSKSAKTTDLGNTFLGTGWLPSAPPGSASTHKSRSTPGSHHHRENKWRQRSRDSYRRWFSSIWEKSGACFGSERLPWKSVDVTGLTGKQSCLKLQPFLLHHKNGPPY